MIGVPNLRALLLLPLLLSGSCVQPDHPGEATHPRAAPALHSSVVSRVPAPTYLTIEQAPASTPEPASPRPVQSKTIYAEIAGVSNEEAQKRVEQQQAIRPEFERVARQLRLGEKGNYTDAELIHRPDWAYLFYFKRQPEQTLRKYSRNPRFKARPAPYTEAELRELSKAWIARLSSERLFTGYGINTRHGQLDVDMVVSEEEFAAIAARNGWGATPDYLRFRFGKAPTGPAVDPSVASGIRIFPQSDRDLGLHHQAGFSGRIVLRDGCFKVITFDGKEHLAYFPREAGLYRDPQGHLALRTRTDPARHLGRIGEEFSWAGPIAVAEDAPMVRELRAQCGTAPMMHVAIPESSAMFNARYGLPRNPPPPPPVPQQGRR
jgi:hypothetical protein